MSNKQKKQIKTKATLKTLPNGNPNPKYVDLLNEYPVIPSQKWGCYSFISPDDIIKKKELFMFEQFVKQWEYTKTITMYSDFMHYLAFKYKLNMDTLLEDFKEFVISEETTLKKNGVFDDFASFMDTNDDVLNKKYQADNNFQTSVRGFVNIGSFGTEEEAKKYSMDIRSQFPQHDVLVGQNFVWVPLNPDMYKTGNIEYMEEELNELHHEKVKNAKKAKEEFDKRVYDSKLKAINNNIELAKVSNNKLTQTMDEQGNLIGVTNTVDFDSRDVA